MSRGSWKPAVLLLWGACMMGFDRSEAAVRAQAPAWLEHPSGKTTTVTLVGGGHLGAFYRAIVVDTDGSSWDGWMLLDGDRRVDPGGPDAAEARLATLGFDGSGVSAEDWARWLETLGALPPGVKASDVFVQDTAGHGATLTAKPATLTMLVLGSDLEQRTAGPFGTPSPGGFSGPRWATAKIVFDGGKLQWTVTDLGAVVSHRP